MKTILTLFVFLFWAATTLAATGQTVDYKVDDETFEGYYISPAKDAPLILLIHDWDGLTGYEVKRAQMLADLGYAVFAADLFGKGVRPTEVADKRQHTGELYKDRARMRRLLGGALKTDAAQGGNIDNAVSIGYCFGGAAVLEQARAGTDLKGFVTFHGGLGTPEGQDYNKTKGKLLIMHGSADTAITLQDFADLATRLEQAGVAHEMITYSGAPHAFTVFDGNRYHKDADEKSWSRFLQFLKETF
ncbi:MAG: dienelactone hydrolase [Desulfuromonas sp.]|nr:MAG: dienelactone hydrolase [Desulfuromonas sp.]